MKKCLYDEIFKIISEVVSENKIQAYVVGGYVRDCILNRPSKDIDIVVIGNGIEIAKKVAERLSKNLKVNVFKNFGTAHIKYKDYELEFVGARKESYQRSSRKPIVEDGTLEDDQNRRDFTINALALGLNIEIYGELIDPFNGIKDIGNKTIKTPLNPDTTFSDDPLRMLRAIRFAAQLDFKIEKKTFNAIKKNKSRIEIISQERIVEELYRIILSPKPSKGFVLLDESGLMQLVLPELYKLKGIEVVKGIKHKDNFYHSIKVLDNISKKTDNLWLRWSALLHDIGKPYSKKFQSAHGWTFHGHEHIGIKKVESLFRRLKMPLNEKMKYVQKIVSLHHRPMILSSDEVTDSAIRRLLFEASDDVDDLLTLCEADITSQNKELRDKYRSNFNLVREKIKEIEEKDVIRNFQPPVSGEEIMKAFNISPGKEVGIIKNAIKDAILDGVIKNNYEEAYQLMIDQGIELGLELPNPDKLQVKSKKEKDKS